MSDRPSTEDALRAVTLITGQHAEAGKPTRCPRCGSDTLTISPNGSGAHYTGCSCTAEILDALLDGALRAKPKVDADNPITVLRALLELPGLIRVVKQGRAGEAYDLELGDGHIIELGSAADLLIKRRLEAAIFGQADVLIRSLKPGEHRDVVRLIGELAELREIPTAVEQTAGWVAAYLETTGHDRNVDTTDSDRIYELLGPTARRPMTDIEGRVHLRLEGLAHWINRLGGIDRIGTRELATRLSRLDFKATQHSARRGDDVRKARYWTSPPGWEATR